jgi:hypothetical protein
MNIFKLPLSIKTEKKLYSAIENSRPCKLTYTFSEHAISVDNVCPGITISQKGTGLKA